MIVSLFALRASGVLPVMRGRVAVRALGVLTAMCALAVPADSASARAAGTRPVLRFTPTTLSVGQQFIATVTGCPAGSTVVVGLSHPIGGGRGTPTWGRKADARGTAHIVEVL